MPVPNPKISSCRHVVVVRDGSSEHDETEHVESDDRHHHPDYAGPLFRSQRVLNDPQSCSSRPHRIPTFP